MTPRQEASDRSWAQLALVTGAIAVALGALALAGWVFGVDQLTAIRSGLIPMAPSTAVLFGLFGGLLLLDGQARPALAGASPWKLSLSGAGTAAAFGLLLLSSMGLSPEAEHLWLNISGEVAGAPVGHMSPLTALGFVLAGAAYLLTTLPSRYRRPRAAFVLAALLTVLALTLTSAYLLSRPLLYDTGTIPPALNTSVAFLALGGGLLGACARRVWPREADTPQPQPVFPVLGILVIAAFLVLTPAYLLFRDYAEDFREEIEEQLLAVADLKVAQLQSWRAERLSDASVFHDNPVFASLLDRSLYQGDPGATREIEAWLRSVADAYDYPRIVVVDSGGQRRLTVPDTGLHATDAPPGMGPVLEAMRRGDVVIRDFHRDTPNGPLHLSVLAPVVADGRPLGAVALRANPALKLYPTLRWPTPTHTAETLLVGREGDDVVFLSDLRFRDDAALNLRAPLSDEDLPAAMAVRGAEGIVEGYDYRDERVIAAVRKVPDTGWWLVARMDTHEAFGPLQNRLGWTVAAVIALLLGVAGILGFGWQRREKVYYRGLARTQRRHSTLLHSIGDGVISTDAKGRVEIMNPVAEELTGWTEEEAVGRPLEDVFTIVNEETREPVESPVEKVLREGDVVGLANSTVLIGKDGTERPIADSGAPVLDADGTPSGVILVFRDHTDRRQAEEALRRNEARYRNLVHSIRDAIVVANTDREIIGCNPAFAELFGYQEEEILGKQTSELYESREEFETMGQELQKHLGDPSFVQTIRYRKKSGEVFPGETNAFYLTDSEGAVVGFIGLIRDATRRQEARRALEESEARYRTLYEAAPIGIFRSRSDGTALAANQVMADILGFESPEDAVRHYDELGQQLYVRPDRRDEFLNHLREHGYVEDFEYEAHKRSGGTKWIEMHARVAGENDDGTFDIEGFAIDITEDKRREEELRKQQAMLERTEQIAQIGSWELDLATEEVTWSNELFRIFGLDPEEDAPSFEAHAQLLAPGEMERLEAAVERAVEHGEAYTLELQIVRPDGSTREIRARGHPVPGPDGAIVQLVGFVEDITEEKAREERAAELQSQLSQAQKMESIGRLAGGVAHDFNNMLSVILGHVEMAQERLEPEELLYRDLEAVREAAESSADLTRQLLAFAREQVVTPEVLDLNQTVGSMLKMLRRLIGENIDLQWRPGSTAWPVRVDPVQIDQVLTNLLVNARDAIDGVGQVTIDTAAVSVDEEYAEVHPDARPGDYMVLSVTDNGPGMEPSVAERVFDPFFTTKAPGEGTGLGLATVYGIVRQNDGFIHLYTEPGEGATFKIYFPRSAEEAGEPRPKAEPDTAVGTETVLVVEDQAAVLGLVEKILDRLGYTVITAGTPGNALELVQGYSDPIHLLITDVIMPEMNGQELAEKVAERVGGIPVLFMSGYAEEVIADRGVIEDGIHFIEKPFTRSELAARVREALQAP